MSDVLTDHQKNWWGTQPCRRCNPGGLDSRNLAPNVEVLCANCDGSGWTVWAALSSDPWNEIIRGLFVGGHDRLSSADGGGEIVPVYPKDYFDLVISMYHRDGYEPTGGRHCEYLFPDGGLTPKVVDMAIQAGREASHAFSCGSARVFIRCQAGLNRASLVAGVAMIDLGFEAADAVQLLRSRRSPWALCNEEFADFLSSGKAASALSGAARSSHSDNK